MGRRSRTSSEARISRLEAMWFRRSPELRHRPFLRSHAFSSRGFRMRTWSVKARQIVHLHSALEFQALLMADFDPKVVGLREQIPLRRRDTRCIAEGHGVRHPRYPGSQVDTVMTTDFLVRHQSAHNKLYDVAWAVKPWKEADPQNRENTRTLEKLHIEREYWENQGVRWRLITERDMNPTILENVEWMSPAVNVPDFDCTAGELVAMAVEVLDLWTPDAPLGELAAYAGNKLGLNRQMAVARLYRCIWNRLLLVDLAHAPLSELRPLALVMDDEVTQ